MLKEAGSYSEVDSSRSGFFSSSSFIGRKELEKVPILAEPHEWKASNTRYLIGHYPTRLSGKCHRKTQRIDVEYVTTTADYSIFRQSSVLQSSPFPRMI